VNYAARLQKKIPQSYIDELLGAIHISDIVKSRINLRENHDNRGISYSANCPFHDDQALSLHIDDNTGTYTCNTCDITGTSIGFIMYFDGIHFIDAVQELSETCGMSLSSVISDHIVNEPQKKHVNLLSNIASYFHVELSNHNHANDYLQDRGISNESIKQFNLGYAPQHRDYFQAVFPNKKTPLIRAGVCGENTDKTTFARFRDRIMFPVYSPEKEIIGFGGRSLVDGGPKYLNSPTSRYFNKSDVLFGLSHYEQSSKDSCSTGFDAIVVEGYMDVVVAHQHGFQYTVSHIQPHHYLETSVQKRLFLFRWGRCRTSGKSTCVRPSITVYWDRL